MEKIVNKCKVGGGAFQSTLNGGLLNKNFYQTSRLGFTLAEMMVVMLILSIIMAAMAPVMTTRNKLDQSSPWSWATNGSDAYYGIGDAQVAMIGQEEVKPTDDGARFIINSPSSLNHILFKNGDTTNGRLNMSNNSVLLGKTASGQTLGSYSTGLGSDIGPSGTGSVAIGHLSKSTENYAIAQGYDNFVSGLNSIAIGKSNIAREQDSIVLGRSNTVNGQDSIILGRNNEVNSNNSIGIGLGVTSAESSIAIGNGALASGDNSMAIGTFNTFLENQGANGLNSIAIGYLSYAGYDSALAIGDNAHAYSNYTIAIGVAAKASDKDNLEQDSIAIGRLATSTERSSIAIGAKTKARSYNGIAIGYNACQYSTAEYGVVCIGADSGPLSDDTNLKDKDNIVFLGNQDHTVYIPGNLVVEGDVILARDAYSQVTARARYAGEHIIGWAGTEMGILKSEDFNGDDDNLDIWDYQRTNNSNFFNFWLSDRRLKYVGSESTSGLDKIRQLKVFNYTFKKDKKKVPHVGVIAQDLQKVFPNAVKKGVDGFLTIRMEDMFYAMINAIKELDSKISTLEKENKELKAALKQLQENNKKQEARLKALEAKIK